MADIRIKDLTTTASSTASDDFFAADGTTNGTRKLSAFSPSFGGNATVGGTLTVNGTGTNTISGTTVLSGSGTVQASLSQSSTGQVGLEFTRAGGTAVSWVAYIPTGSTDLRLFAGSSDQFIFSGAGRLSIPATTASTTTSSGALVVGNGTSGGLGVGGNAYIGGDLVVATGTKGIYSQGYVTVKGQQANLLSRGTPAGWTAGLHFYTSGNDYSASIIHYPDNGNLQFYINATSSNYAASDEALRITTAKQVQVLATTASTSTSSGALVVSGGVGVAGAIYGGGNLLVSGTGKIGAVTAADSRFHVYESSAVDVGNGVTIEQAGTGDAVTAFLLTGVQRWSVGIDNSDSDKFKIGTGALGSADRLTIDTSGNTTIAGTLQVGNAYVAGAPTATGYIVIKDSTGTSYKIPAQAL